MDGILIIDKPAGITSHDVVSRVRRILRTKRVGHTGTLDPFATGVMVMVVGQATRLAQFLDKDEKAYEALIRFGFETDTGDRTGSPSSDIQDPRSLSAEKVRSVLDNFRGEIMQTPPMFSAKKVDGKKLYEHARKGETIERKSILVTIHELEVIGEPRSADIEHSTSDLGLKVVCSAGTYIRTLAEEIGRKVGIGAHLAELRRTRAGKFTIDQSLTLEQLAEHGDPQQRLIAMKEAVSHLPNIVLPDDRIQKTQNGLSTRIIEAKFADGDAVQMHDAAGSLIAIGFYNRDENSVQPKVVLV
jgi:tRNA pseudouridine55 synthase